MKNPKKLIIFTHGGGRFANQLISYAHLIAFLIENDYNYDLINMAFWSYSHLLENTANNPFCTFPTQHNRGHFLRKLRNILDKLPTRLSQRIKVNTIRYLYLYSYFMPKRQSIIAQDASGLNYTFGKHKDKFDLNNPDDINLLNQADITLLSGWKIRSWSLFKKHENIIKDNLALKGDYLTVAENFIKSLKRQYNFLIGVLIRQKDYQIFAEGKYYFTTSQYINWIKQAREIFSVDYNVGFIIAADEPQDLEVFKNLDVHFATGIAGSQGHYLESMSELSLCNLIMTPPSTFSTWAAFLGNVPILPLYETSQILTDKDILENNIFDAIIHPHMSAAVQ